MNALSKEYEEVEVEVPSPIYETIKLYNGENGAREGAEEEDGGIPNKTRNTADSTASPSKRSNYGNAGTGKKANVTLTSRIKSLFARS